MNNRLPQNLRSFIWHFLKPYKKVVFLYITLALLAGCWGPFNSMLIKYMINLLSLSPVENLSLLSWPAALLVLNFIVLDNVTWRSIGYLTYKFQPVINNQMVTDTFRYVLGLSPQFFHDNMSGTIARQITRLAENIETIIFRQVLADFIRAFSLLLVAFITMYYVNPLFFYSLLVWFFCFFSFSIGVSKRIIVLSDIHAKSEAAISGKLVDSIANNSNVRIFARNEYELLYLENSLLTYKKTFQAQQLFLLKVWWIQGMLIAGMLGFVVCFLIHLYGKHLITVGDFALILGLSMEVGHTTWYTMGRVDDFNQAVGKCKQSLKGLMVPQEIQDKKDAQKLVVTQGSISFKDVTFQYKNSKPLFQNKTMTIKSGQKVGLVGYSGGGKSTFVNLICRLYDVTAGHIFIDDQDISHVTQDSLRGNIAVIPQEASLFHRTIMENIRYGRIDAMDTEVIEASKKAHAHEFISTLPNSYESLVGERGIKLSGGQRQRIAIARAILKNAPILILDEATSQLDSVTEVLIQESLWELMQGKTTIVIAHRLSTLLHMDRILVFDQGNIVEDGTHAELLARGGLYKTLWDAQVGGFLPDKADPSVILG